VSSVFVFCPDGTTPICCYNIPDSIHDSKIAEWGGVYHKLSKVFRKTRGKCCTDSAFSLARCPFILKAGQANYENLNCLVESYNLSKEIASIRQTLEWGMRCMQASFPRLKDRFYYKEFGERKLILKLCILLHNLRARRVGINQIKNVYIQNLDVNTNDFFAECLWQEA
jgi:DDE superfamily endonuclease